MTEFTDNLKSLANRRNFAEVRASLYELSTDVDRWKEEMLTGEIYSMVKDAAKNSDIEKVSAILHNPYKNIDKSQFSDQQRLRVKSFEEAFDELVGNSAPITFSDIQRREMGKSLPAAARSFGEALEWDEKIYSITDDEIRKVAVDLQALEDSDEKNQGYKELASILIGRRSRGFEIPNDIWNEAFPQMPDILEEEKWPKKTNPDGSLSENLRPVEPDNLWSGVFLEMVWQNIQPVVTQMLYSLDEDIRNEFVASGVCSWAIEDANEHDGHGIAQIIQDIRNESGIEIQDQSEEDMFANDITYSQVEDIEFIIANSAPEKIRDLLLSEDGREGFGGMLTTRTDNIEQVVSMLLNALTDEDDILFLLTEEIGGGLPLAIAAESSNDEQSSAILKAMLDQLSPENQQLLILDGEEEEYEGAGLEAFKWTVRNNNIESAQLLLSYLPDVEQQQALINRVTEEALLQNMSPEMREIFDNILEGQELSGSDRESLEDDDMEQSDSGQNFDYEAFENMLNDLVNDPPEPNAIPSTSTARPRSPTEEDRDAKRQRGGGNEGL
jgi:hypothetical protein